MQWRRTTMKSGPSKDNAICNYYVIANSWANDMTFENFHSSIKHVKYIAETVHICSDTYVQFARTNGVILKSYKSVLENVANTLRRCSVLAKVFAISIIEI